MSFCWTGQSCKLRLHTIASLIDVSLLHFLIAVLKKNTSAWDSGQWCVVQKKKFFCCNYNPYGDTLRFLCLRYCSDVAHSSILPFLFLLQNGFQFLMSTRQSRHSTLDRGHLSENHWMQIKATPTTVIRHLKHLRNDSYSTATDTSCAKATPDRKSVV